MAWNRGGKLGFFRMKISNATKRIINIYGKRTKVGKCTQNVKIRVKHW